MQLDSKQRARIEAEAAKRGADPKAAIAHAENIAAAREAKPGDESSPAASGKPTFERFLIGALPFVTVREFRSEWLGLTAPVPDDHLMTGDFLAKHGGAPSSAPTPEEPAP